ncbi:hypothetical protein ACFLR1_04060 [Bacteroidota bacterium]
MKNVNLNDLLNSNVVFNSSAEAEKVMGDFVTRYPYYSFKVVKKEVGFKIELNKKSYKEFLLAQNWVFETHEKANEVAFHYAIVSPEFKFSVVKRGNEFVVGIKENDKGEYLNF